MLLLPLLLGHRWPLRLPRRVDAKELRSRFMLGRPALPVLEQLINLRERHFTHLGWQLFQGCAEAAENPLVIYAAPAGASPDAASFVTRPANRRMESVALRISSRVIGMSYSASTVSSGAAL